MKKIVVAALLAGAVIFQIYAKPFFVKSRNAEYASYLRGLMAQRYNESDKALEELSKASRQDRESGVLRLKVAVEHIKRGENDSAIEILSALSNGQHLNLDAYLLLILMHSTDGDEEQAAQVYSAMLEKLYDSDRSNIDVASKLAHLKLEDGDYDSAIDVYKRIIEKEPENQSALFWLGYLYERTGNIDPAIDVWTSLVKINPQHSNALNSLGYMYAEKGINLEKAEELVKKALANEPDSPAFLDSLGWIYYKQGKYNDALYYIKKAAEGLDDPVIYDHLADIYEKLGRSDKAKEIRDEQNAEQNRESQE